jgi:O-antigen/teichoic acid export membrane protein
VNRPVARRRGGATLTTVGFLGVGGSFALLGGAGPWLLHQHVTSGLTLVMVLASVFGFGVASPIEQLVSRRLNAGGGGGSREPLRWLLLAGVLTAATAAVAVRDSSYAHLFHWLVPGVILAVAGWVAVVTVRSRLAGAGDLWSYAAVLVVEAVVRLLLIAAAIIDRGDDVALLGAAVGVPLLVAAGAAALIRVPPAETRPVDEPKMTVRARVGEQGSFVAVALCYQICLNALTLVLSARGAATATVSAVGAANSYFLAPTVLMGGVTTHALVSLSHAWGRRDLAAFVATKASSLRRGTLTAVVATGLAAAVEPVALPFYYDHDLGLPVVLLASMALSTVVTVVAVVAIQPLLAAGHGRPAALAWLAGAAVTVVALALSSGTNWLACVALLGGPAVALVGAWSAADRMVAHWPQTGTTT